MLLCELRNFVVRIELASGRLEGIAVTHHPYCQISIKPPLRLFDAIFFFKQQKGQHTQAT